MHDIEQGCSQRASQLFPNPFPIDDVPPGGGWCVALRRDLLKQFQGEAATREFAIHGRDAKQVEEFAFGEDVMRRGDIHQIGEGRGPEVLGPLVVEHYADSFPNHPSVREGNRLPQHENIAVFAGKTDEFSAVDHRVKVPVDRRPRPQSLSDSPSGDLPERALWMFLHVVHDCLPS